MPESMPRPELSHGHTRRTPTAVASPALGDGGNTAAWVDAERTRLAYRQSSTGLAVNTLVTLALAALLWDYLPRETLSLWLLAMLIVTGARAWLVHAYEQALPTDAELARWRHRIVWGASLNALTWGATGFLMTPHLAIGYQALLALVLAGLAAGGLASLALLLGAYLFFVCALLGPVTVWFVLQGTEMSLALGCISVIFMGAMAALARNYEHSVSNALGLAHQNGRLIDCLTRAHSLAASANRSLQAEIVEREHAETAVRDSEVRFRDFAELGADLFWEVDTKLRYVRVLGHCEDVLGMPATSLVGKSATDLGWCEVENADEREAHLALLAARQPFSDYQYSFRRPDGHTVVLSSSGKPTYAANGVYIGYRGVARNVTEAHSLSEKLRYQATHDALTGLYNRHELERRLERVITVAGKEASEHALAFLDLDQFKVVNDTCGHTAGDELLRQLAELLKTRVRTRDTLARLGGDEFALLLEHCTLDQAEHVVRDIRQTVDEYLFETEGRAFRLGVSIGVVPIRRLSGDLQQVMSDADSACYAAKEAGRNRIYICREDDDLLRKRHGEMQWVSKIIEALEQNRFCLYAQPIVPIRPLIAPKESVQLLFVDAASLAPAPTPCKTHGGEHFEVLLRMVDPQGRTIPPGAFLPSAEQYNLSPRLDRWVVSATFDWLAANRKALERLTLCSINLSGNSLGDEDFGTFVTEQLERTGVPAEKICFEITETAAISRIAAATQLIHRLKRHGFQFALDDFGSGLSSFGYLKRLPVDFLKIDGLFIRDITGDRIDYAMVKSINEIGHVMGKKTVAEFVENDETLIKLREIGVDYAQGYGIGEPTPLEDLL